MISSRIDTIALVLADEPVTRERVEPLLDALESQGDELRLGPAEMEIQAEDATGGGLG